MVQNNNEIWNAFIWWALSKCCGTSGSVFAILLWAIVIGVTSESKEGLLYEIILADDLVLISSESKDEARGKFWLRTYPWQ